MIRHTTTNRLTHPHIGRTIQVDNIIGTLEEVTYRKEGVRIKIAGDRFLADGNELVTILPAVQVTTGGWDAGAA